MKSVKIKSADLLEVLKKNRETHVSEFNSAKEEYRKDVIAEMKKNLKQAQSGGEIVSYIQLVEPQNFTASYDTAIKMLEMSADELVELTMQEFQQYVEDNWHWKGTFAASTSIYNNKVAMK
jgi:hypothetical protein